MIASMLAVLAPASVTATALPVAFDTSTPLRTSVPPTYLGSNIDAASVRETPINTVVVVLVLQCAPHGPVSA